MLDELHAMHNSKRGDLLSLGLARLAKLAPGHRRVGLSATVADPAPLQRYLVPQPEGGEALVGPGDGRRPARSREISISASEAYVPWAGHLALHAMVDIMKAIKASKTALVFVNTRSQAERTFQELWRINDENLPIALHHGSLAPEQRRKVEAAMTRGDLRAVVCTSTLDLGIDWGAVDRVICVGAPKGRRAWSSASAAPITGSTSRRGRCWCRRTVSRCSNARPRATRCWPASSTASACKRGGLDVLAQHVLGWRALRRSMPMHCFAKSDSASPYHGLARADFDRIVDFVATGGYALKRYDRYARLRRTPEGLWRVAHPEVAQHYRLNVGVIIEEPMLDIRLQSQGAADWRWRAQAGPARGIFPRAARARRHLRLLGSGPALRRYPRRRGLCHKTNDPEAQVPSYMGGKFPLSTFLARPRARDAVESRQMAALPHPVDEWLRIQQWRSVIPMPGQLLVETFPRGSKRVSRLLSFRRPPRASDARHAAHAPARTLAPAAAGFLANEYALASLGLRDMGGVDMDRLFDEDMLGDDLDAWLAESPLQAHLPQLRDHCGADRAALSGPREDGPSGHVFLRSHLRRPACARARSHTAARNLRGCGTGLLDIISAFGDARARKGQIVVKRLDRVSPLAVPALLEIGREMVAGEAHEDILREAEEALVEGGDAPWVRRGSR